jgi:hypothetical protein
MSVLTETDIARRIGRHRELVRRVRQAGAGPRPEAYVNGIPIYLETAEAQWRALFRGLRQPWSKKTWAALKKQEEGARAPP